MSKFHLNINRYELENTVSSHYVGTLFHENLDLFFVFTSFGRGTLDTKAYCDYPEFQETTLDTIKKIKDCGWRHETVMVDAQIPLRMLPIQLGVMSGLESEIETAFEFVKSTLPKNLNLETYNNFGSWK